ncbi:MAG: hypothetical protein H6600_06330 [Flavobacteriales bacterium]|nr:hypothetical protein [Flavobacteriales bacterium]
MKRFIIFLLILPILASAGQDNSHYGGRSAAMGHASVSLYDVWSTHHNQAGLGWLTNPTAGVFFQNRNLLKEFNYMGFAYAHPLSTGTIGASFTNFGSNLYGESKLGISYGMKFSDFITGGVAINYHNTRIAYDYGSHSAVTAELGMQAYLNDNFMLAAHLFNPTRSKLNDYNDERIPTIIRLGLNYKFSDKVMTVLEAQKDLLNSPSFKAGIEYNPNDIIYLRAGIGTTPSLASFGVGLKMNQMQLDIAASYHNTLGFWPELSFQYQLKGKKEN